MNDLRQAFRTLRRQPGFTVLAVLTLAVGIGISASFFSILSAFFLQPLPVRDAHQLVLVMQRGDVVNVPYGHSYPDYLDYRRATKTFSDLAAYLPTPVHVSARGQTPERTWIEVTSPNYFAVAGVTPALGAFPRTDRDERTGAAPAVVALGAARSDVVRLVVREGMWLSLIGIGIGLVLALGLGLVLSKALYGMRPADPGVLGSIAFLLLVVSAAACYLPARRATRVDPMTALRHQ